MGQAGPLNFEKNLLIDDGCVGSSDHMSVIKQTWCTQRMEKNIFDVCAHRV